jgi:hypothetical protein
MNPFNQQPVVGNFKPTIGYDPNSGRWFRMVDGGWGFSYPEYFPDDQQIPLEAMEPGVEPPNPGAMPFDMQKGIANPSPLEYDSVIASSANQVVLGNIAYNANVVLQGYYNAMKVYIPHRETYEKPQHPAQFYQEVSYEKVYNHMREGKGPYPRKPVPNYQLIRKSR